MKVFYRQEQAARTQSFSPSAFKPALVLDDWRRHPEFNIEVIGFEPVSPDQLALAHKYSMELMADASKQRDPIIKVKLINCSARLMDAYSKGALALQRLQQGANQIVQVQHVQVHGQAVIGNIGGRP